MKNSFQISHSTDQYTKPIYFHSHDFYEIYFFMDGNVKYYIENESYNLTKGDVLLIPPGKLHRPVIEENVTYERYVLWLYSNYISSDKGIGKYIEIINSTISEKNTRLAYFDKDSINNIKGLFDKLIYNSLSDEELAQFNAESCIILILGEILEKLRHAEKANEYSGGIIKQVISYINQNVTNAPSLDELSAKFFVSKYYLSHKFKEYTKTTVHQYILLKKINLAKEMLEKGKSPKEVSSLCGFSTYSNFYKVFTQKTGISPKDYGRRI